MKLKPVHAGAFLGAIFSVVAISYPVMHAKSIPGVDKPYDSSAYYSSTAVSYADSKPSVFALKELMSGGPGGTPVFDPARFEQETLVEQYVRALLEKLGIRLDLYNIENIKKLATKHTVYIDGKIDVAQKKSKELDKVAEMEDERVFGEKPSELERDKYSQERQKELNSYTLDKQLEVLSEQYQQIVETTRKNQEDVQGLQESLKEILEFNNEVEGEEQAWELNTKAKALQTEIITRENIIASQLLQLRSIEQRRKIVLEEADKEMLLHAAENTKVDDPFDEKAKKFWEELGFERHKVDPWPEFE